MSTLAERLKQLRSSARMTGEDFGKVIGVSKAYISQLESGRRINLDPTKKAQLARLFNVSTHWIDTGEGEGAKIGSKSDHASGANTPEVNQGLAGELEKVKKLLPPVDSVNHGEVIKLLRKISEQMDEIIKKLPGGKR